MRHSVELPSQSAFCEILDDTVSLADSLREPATPQQAGERRNQSRKYNWTLWGERAQNLWLPLSQKSQRVAEQLLRQTVASHEANGGVNLSNQETDIPKKIHQVWLGPKSFPVAAHKDRSTFRDAHPDWSYHLWCEEFIPGLVELYKTYFHEGENISDVSAVVTNKKLNPAYRSDIVRLIAIYVYGGLYVDTDFACIKPFDLLHDCGIGFYCGLATVGAFEINNGIFAARAKHPLTKFLLDRILIDWESWGGDDVPASSRAAQQIPALAQMLQLGQKSTNHHDENKSYTDIIQDTGPGFFTRGVFAFLDLAEAHHNETGEFHDVVVFPEDVFFPLPNEYKISKQREQINLSFEDSDDSGGLLSKSTKRDCCLTEEDISQFVTGRSMAVHKWACSWQS